PPNVDRSSGHSPGTMRQRGINGTHSVRKVHLQVRTAASSPRGLSTEFQVIPDIFVTYLQTQYTPPRARIGSRRRKIAPNGAPTAADPRPDLLRVQDEGTTTLRFHRHGVLLPGFVLPGSEPVGLDQQIHRLGKGDDLDGAGDLHHSPKNFGENTQMDARGRRRRLRTFMAVSRVLMSTRRSESATASTGDCCTSPPRRCVASTAWWLLRT